MADGFIVRKGGVTTEQTLAPTITKVSNTGTSITFTLKNNDAATATLVYRYSSLTGDGESISLATNTTSSNITLSSIGIPGTLFVTANSIGKVKSNVVEEKYEITFTAATGGTTLEYDSGGKRFRSHTFTSNGNFVVNTVGDNVDDRNKVDYLIIAGGGSGGGDASGGGGAGGYLTTLGATSNDVTPNTKFTVTATTFGVVVGAGGTSVSADIKGNNGSNSSALSITSTGGGGGGSFSNSEATVGGSGGGGHFNNGAGAAGTSGQGFAGGNGQSSASPVSGGGGGGAGVAGSNGTSSNGGAGGNGLANLLRTGSNETRAGGGGGFIDSSGGTEGIGGTGGGGRGAKRFNVTPTSGTANTGGGGGAGDNNSGASYFSGAGGSGIVVIRYEIAPSV